MACYDFTCNFCEHTYELSQSIKLPLPDSCPKCGATAPDFHQIYHAVGVAIVYGSPKTVGQQAEINARRAGSEQMDRMWAAEAAKRVGWKGPKPEGVKEDSGGSSEVPWWRSGAVPGVARSETPIDLKKIRDPAKFVQTGETT